MVFWLFPFGACCFVLPAFPLSLRVLYYSRFVNKSEVLEYVEKDQLPISLGGTVSYFSFILLVYITQFYKIYHIITRLPILTHINGEDILIRISAYTCVLSELFWDWRPHVIPAFCFLYRSRISVCVLLNQLTN